MKRKLEVMNGMGGSMIPSIGLPDCSRPPPMFPSLPASVGYSHMSQPPPPPPINSVMGMNYVSVVNRGGWNPNQMMGPGMRQMYVPPRCGNWQNQWRGPRVPNQRGFYQPQRFRANRATGPRYGGGYQDYNTQNWTPQSESANVAADAAKTSEADGESKKDKKRRSMSQSYPSRPWNEADAERALQEENNHMKGLRNQSLIIRFPDPDLSKDIVKSFHTAIDNVHFQVPSGARYCFVQLSDKVNAEKTIKELEQIKFGAGKLKVEKKFHKDEEDISPDAIDPYTLYIGNLPTNINVGAVKEKFPTAARIDIGFAQKMKYTRYAFIRYNTVEEAIDAYRTTHNLVLDSRSIIVRFRRQRGHVGMPGEIKPPKIEKEPEKGKTKKKEKTNKTTEDVEDEEEEDDDDDDDDEEDDEVEEDDDEEDDEPPNDDVEEDDDEDDDDDEVDDEENPVEDDDEEDAAGSLFLQLDSQIGDLGGGSIFRCE